MPKLRNYGFLIFSCLGACMANVALAQANPIDEISNPLGREFDEISVSSQEMSPLFYRDGVEINKSVFSDIEVGDGPSEVRTLLGEPIKSNSPDNHVWNYSFRMKMASSQNFFICQYKVIFDDRMMVKDVVWRRRQCQDLAKDAL